MSFIYTIEIDCAHMLYRYETSLNEFFKFSIHMEI